MISIKSYLPPEEEKRSQSTLQHVKNKHRSFTQTNKEGFPKDLKELKAIKHRDHAISFLDQYMNISKKTSKSQYCKINHISHNTLNNGLNQLGYKTRINKTNLDISKTIKVDLDQTSSIENNLDQLKRNKTKKSKHNISREIKAGQPTYLDEEINEMINNSLATLSAS